MSPREDRRSCGAATWRGPRPGTLTLANTAGVVNGKVSLTNGTVYEIGPVQGSPGLQRVLEMDQSAFPRELQPVPVQAPPAAVRDVPQALDDGSTVDVIVAYTGFRFAGGGWATPRYATSSVSPKPSLTTAFANSGILFHVRIVHTAKVAFDESVGFNTTLERLSGRGDGQMDEIHTLRDQYGADAVSLWINDGGACGTRVPDDRPIRPF